MANAIVVDNFVKPIGVGRYQSPLVRTIRLLCNRLANHSIFVVVARTLRVVYRATHHSLSSKFKRIAVRQEGGHYCAILWKELRSLLYAMKIFVPIVRPCCDYDCCQLASKMSFMEFSL
jgi:hypothetical protein